MASTGKRKLEDEKLPINSSEDFRRLLSSAISTYESAEMAILWLMREYRFDLSLLRQSLRDEGLKFSSSDVKFCDIAELVGLEHEQKLKDLGTFNLYRSRIPTHLFRSIVEDMDVLLIQFGPLPDQKNEETRSRFFAPIFNRLIAVFGFAFRNLPEWTIEGRITTKGRIECYFRAFGSISVYFIEVKFVIGDTNERLDTIAQVIAECDACDLNNATQGFHVPVIGILCDGTSFEFFSFNASNSRKFTRGCLPGDPKKFRRGLRLADFTLDGPGPFIADLRRICEIMFDLLMGAYISSLTAFRDRSQRRGNRELKSRKSLDKWDEALKHAQGAFTKFRAAETKREGGNIGEANNLVEEAMKALKLSIELLPISDQTDLIMTGWDDAKVEKV